MNIKSNEEKSLELLFLRIVPSGCVPDFFLLGEGGVVVSLLPQIVGKRKGGSVTFWDNILYFDKLFLWFNNLSYSSCRIICPFSNYKSHLLKSKMSFCLPDNLSRIFNLPSFSPSWLALFRLADFLRVKSCHVGIFSGNINLFLFFLSRPSIFPCWGS